MKMIIRIALVAHSLAMTIQHLETEAGWRQEV